MAGRASAVGAAFPKNREESDGGEMEKENQIG